VIKSTRVKQKPGKCSGGRRVSYVTVSEKGPYGNCEACEECNCVCVKWEAWAVNN
jgi:hypothetical protein